MLEKRRNKCVPLHKRQPKPKCVRKLKLCVKIGEIVTDVIRNFCNEFQLLSKLSAIIFNLSVLKVHFETQIQNIIEYM